MSKSNIRKTAGDKYVTKFAIGKTYPVDNDAHRGSTGMVLTVIAIGSVKDADGDKRKVMTYNVTNLEDGRSVINAEIRYVLCACGCEHTFFTYRGKTYSVTAQYPEVTGKRNGK